MESTVFLLTGPIGHFKELKCQVVNGVYSIETFKILKWQVWGLCSYSAYCGFQNIGVPSREGSVKGYEFERRNRNLPDRQPTNVFNHPAPNLASETVKRH